MSISDLSKVLFVIHNHEREPFLKFIQKRGVVEISELSQPEVKEAFGDLFRADSDRLNDLVALTSQIDFTLQFLKPYGNKKSFMAPKEQKGVEDLSLLAERFPTRDVIERAGRLNREINENKNQITKLESTADVYRPWLCIDTPISSLRETKHVYQTLFMIYKTPASEVERVMEETGNTHVLTRICAIGDYTYFHFACHQEDRTAYDEALAKIEAEKESLPDADGTFENLVKELEREITELTARGEEQEGEARSLAEKTGDLEALYDHYTIEKEREEVAEEVRSSRDVSFIEGWMPTSVVDSMREDVTGRFDLVEMMPFPPSEDDKPPILLKNRRIVRPYELITELYGMPAPDGVDPTPLLFPFFVIFFGLCLTDAGYGLIMLALMIFAMIKFRHTLGKTKLVGLLTIGAISTIVAGAATGGWFGISIVEPVHAEDVTAALAANPDATVAVTSPLNNFLYQLKLFDPVQDTITFMLICIVLGVVQINFGLLIKMVMNLKRKNFTQALFVQLGWIIFLDSAAVLLTQFMAPGLIPAWGVKTATIAILTAVAAIILFSHQEGNILVRILWGVYAIYGSTSYMGDVLSYLRLLALGLATGIIAAVVNIVAGMVASIPVVGIIAAILILLAGHAFNIAINALGAFVHTTRLQYVEFYTKFFEGGGRPFRPFGIETKYVLIDDEMEK
ncbi:MAG: V-type ATP synthase subunit I [Deltaproteobacteria bacterium]|nr:V-type ATP synthase subunit I [Candidatus Zymogenaceae bacterium]